MAKKKCDCPKPKHEGEGSGSGRWLISYADLLTVLFALFVILYAWKRDNPSRIIEQARGLKIALGSENPPSPVSQGGETDDATLTAATTVPVQAIYDEVSTLQLSDDAQSEIKVTNNAEEILLSYAQGVYFNECSHVIQEAGRRQLDELSKLLNQGNAATAGVEIRGHADGRGLGERCEEIYDDNMDLSYHRAKETYNYLTRLASQPVDDDRVTIRTFGDNAEMYVHEDGDTDRQWANRRIDIMLRHFPLSPDVSGTDPSP